MGRDLKKYQPVENRKTGFIYLLRRFLGNILLLGVVVVGYYIIFSSFDTTLEKELKHDNTELNAQYEKLIMRYDTLQMGLDNAIERDKNVFRILFESEPYDFNDNNEDSYWDTYERLSEMSESDLYKELTSKLSTVDNNLQNLNRITIDIDKSVAELGDKIINIPAIQPIINNELTLLTASYGMRIHPFYKSLALHKGVDYTVPTGTRVFATADGKVESVVTRKTTSGLNVVISHGGGFETLYSHLSQINVRKGQKVRRGDIIALTGNSGLSLAPHLHYEVRYNGESVDPINYFFAELTPREYQRMIKIAQSGMQSFD